MVLVNFFLFITIIKFYKIKEFIIHFVKGVSPNGYSLVTNVKHRPHFIRMADDGFSCK